MEVIVPVIASHAMRRRSVAATTSTTPKARTTALSRWIAGQPRSAPFSITSRRPYAAQVRGGTFDRPWSEPGVSAAWPAMEHVQPLFIPPVAKADWEALPDAMEDDAEG